MAKKKLLSRIKYRWRGPVIRLLLRFLAVMPLRMNHLFGSLIGSLLYRTKNVLRHTTMVNLKLAFPEMDEQQRNIFCKQHLKEAAKTFTEIGPLWFWSQEKVLGLVKKVSGEELLLEAMERGKGAIISAPHIGCWEIIGPYCSVKYPFTIMYRPQRIPEVNEVMINSRTRTGAKLVPTDASGVRGLFAALKRGELIGILPDQDPGKEAGSFAPFMGIQTNTMQLLPKLASKSQATVIFAYAIRLPKGQGYHIHFAAAPEGINEKDMLTSTTALNRGVEQCVEAIPTQYMWCYERFRGRPEGEAHFYS